MDAYHFITRMRREGFSVREVEGQLGISPASRLDDEQREWVSANKAAILAAIKSPGTEIDTGQGGHDLATANSYLHARLAIAAERVCREVHGDSDEQVQSMLDDLCHAPLTDWDALTDHFESQLPPPSGSGRELGSVQVAGHGLNPDAPVEHAVAVRASVQFRLKDGQGGSLLGLPGQTETEVRPVLAEKYGERLAAIDGKAWFGPGDSQRPGPPRLSEPRRIPS